MSYSASVQSPTGSAVQAQEVQVQAPKEPDPKVRAVDTAPASKAPKLH
jgi:hypothetical protein